VPNSTDRFESGRPMPNLMEMLEVIYLDLRTDVAFSIMCSFYAICSRVSIENTESIKEDF
jgi:hypothetical protein